MLLICSFFKYMDPQNYLLLFFFQLIIPSCIRHSHFTPFPKTFFMLGHLSTLDSTSSPLTFSYLSPLICESLSPFSKIFFLTTPPTLEIITPSFRLESCSTAYHLHFLLCLHFSDYILEERVYSFLTDLHFWEH